MKTTQNRFTRELSLLLIVSMVFVLFGCKKETTGTALDPSTFLTSIADTLPEESTTAIPSETTTEATTETSTSSASSESTSATVSEEAPESSETSSDPTATPAITPTVTDTPFPDEVSESADDTTATPTTPPDDIPEDTSTSETVEDIDTPSSVPETETPTPTPTMFPPPENSKSIAISAMQAAVRDLCSGHSDSYTDENGQIITIPFQFNDEVMSNVQKRAEYMASTNHLGHYEIDGTWIMLEAIGGMGSDLTDQGGTLHWQYFWTDHAGQNHYYDSYYDCIYEQTVFLITEHTTKLSTSESKVCYGVGIASLKDSIPSYQGIDLYLVNYGVTAEYKYSYVLVVQGGDEFDSAVFGFDYDYTVE